MKGKTWGNLILCLFILALFVFAVQKISAAPSFSDLLDPPVKISESAKEILDSVTLVRPGIRVWDEGNIVETAFSLENNSAHDVKNIEVVCTFYDNDGRDLGDRDWIVYDTLKASERQIFQLQDKMYINKRASKISCQLVDLELALEPYLAAHRGHAAPDGDAGADGHADNGSGH